MCWCQFIDDNANEGYCQWGWLCILGRQGDYGAPLYLLLKSSVNLKPLSEVKSINTDR